MPPAADPAEASARTVLLSNTDTGEQVAVPETVLRAAPSAAKELRRRLRLADVQSAWTGEGERDVRVDATRRTYTFARYPPLGFFVDVRWFAILGAFLVAACAQIQFLFPCTIGYTQVDVGGVSYCVANESLGQTSPTSCPASVCSKRIPVTLQTYAVLLIGALAGRRVGALAVSLYVAMVCVGAPFGSNGTPSPVWNKGAIVGASGGYFWGFIAAAAIMGVAAERGVGRAGWRSAAWLLPWMLAAECAIYACGIVWMPFGQAIVRGQSVSSLCATVSAGQCVKNYFNWALVPFIPGECFKMFMVWVTVPLSWMLLLRYHRWRHGDAALREAAQPFLDPEAEERGEPAAGEGEGVTDGVRAQSLTGSSGGEAGGKELQLREPAEALKLQQQAGAGSAGGIGTSAGGEEPLLPGGAAV